MRQQLRSPSSTVIPREGGESSTPRPIDSITTVSEYWIARSSRAMTQSVSLQTRARILAASIARALLDLSTLFKPRGRREGRVPASTRGPLREKHTQKTAQQHTGVANHSAFPARWLDGLCRALPGAEFLLVSLTLAKVTDTAPVDATAAFAKHLTVATTARTTRFCRTHGPPFRRSFPGPVDGAGNLQTRRT